MSVVVEVAEGPAVGRVHFQELAEVRLREARILLEAKRLGGAYYLAGYVVECGLKACICRRRMKAGVFPDKLFSREVYTHDLERLVSLANLQAEREHWIGRYPQFPERWGVVSEWNEETRYLRTVDPLLAVQMYEAVSARKLGVIRWLKKYW